MKDVLERFTEKIQEPFDAHNDCFEWTSAKDNYGYGHFWLNGKSIRAHRVSYELFVGPIPEGLEIDHLCRNRSCVRPDHLEIVPKIENYRRGEGDHSKKTHCPKGHAYDEENTYWYQGRRYCKKCHAELTLAIYHRRKGGC